LQVRIHVLKYQMSSLSNTLSLSIDGDDPFQTCGWSFSSNSAGGLNFENLLESK
jgi:hypothetical protein